MRAPAQNRGAPCKKVPRVIHTMPMGQTSALPIVYAHATPSTPHRAPAMIRPMTTGRVAIVYQKKRFVSPSESDTQYVA